MKQHHFVVYARQTEDGQILWNIEESNIYFDDGVIYDPIEDTGQWIDLIEPDDIARDEQMVHDLVKRLS
jgi:hypothetical protein